MAYDIIAQETAAVAATSPAEIAIFQRMDTDADAYTVPVGRIFKGFTFCHNTGTSWDYTFYPGTTSVAANSRAGDGGAVLDGTFHHTSTGFENKYPLYMNAGDKIKRRSSHSWYLMGIETTVNTVSWDTSS